MTRGRLELGNHKLAGLYRGPAERMPWKRARREKCPDEQYRQLWRLVAGAVRDTFANHPEYLTPAGRNAAERSIVKRVTGTLHGYATQVARGRSAGLADAPDDAAARGPNACTTRQGKTGPFSQAGLGARSATVCPGLARALNACLGWFLRGQPEIQRGQHE